MGSNGSAPPPERQPKRAAARAAGRVAATAETCGTAEDTSPDAQPRKKPPARRKRPAKKAAAAGSKAAGSKAAAAGSKPAERAPHTQPSAGVDAKSTPAEAGQASGAAAASTTTKDRPSATPSSRAPSTTKPRASGVRSSGTQPASQPPLAPPKPAEEAEVRRYAIVGAPAGIVCRNAPNIRLVVERGLAVNAESRQRYPEQSIFLDGVYSGAPFLDNKARQYSLDHHAGCPRPLMLATCEQAVVMVLQGLPLGEGQWHLFINEPDLDAVLAAWVLHNHRVLMEDDHRLLRRAMPLIRVQGVIDAHGLEKGVLSALPRRLYDAQKARIYELRGVEIRLKADSGWEKMDATGYVRDTLELLDQELLGPYVLRDVKPPKLDEMSLPARKLAVLCISTEGIYEVETQLRQRYHEELGVVVLDRGKGRMTLRQVDSFLPTSLSDLYPILNRRDPNVDDELENCWGGSDDIGGAPRRTGTGLSGPEVLQIVSEFFTGEGAS